MPFGEQLFQDQLAVAGETVKAFVTLVFLSPFADQQPLAFQPSQERIEGALIDGHAALPKSFPESVPVLLRPKLCQDSQNQTATAQFQAKILEIAGRL